MMKIIFHHWSSVENFERDMRHERNKSWETSEGFLERRDQSNGTLTQCLGDKEEKRKKKDLRDRESGVSNQDLQAFNVGPEKWFTLPLTMKIFFLWLPFFSFPKYWEIWKTFSRKYFMPKQLQHYGVFGSKGDGGKGEVVGIYLNLHSGHPNIGLVSVCLF